MACTTVRRCTARWPGRCRLSGRRENGVRVGKVGPAGPAGLQPALHCTAGLRLGTCVLHARTRALAAPRPAKTRAQCARTARPSAAICIKLPGANTIWNKQGGAVRAVRAVRAYRTHRGLLLVLAARHCQALPGPRRRPHGPRPRGTPTLRLHLSTGPTTQPRSALQRHAARRGPKVPLRGPALPARGRLSISCSLQQRLLAIIMSCFRSFSAKTSPPAYAGQWVDAAIWRPRARG